MIATVVVSYKRPELLQRTLVSYLETVTLPFELLVVDNGGSEEALTVARDLGVTVLSFGANLFPGHSTNTGWDILIKDKRDDQISYLHRSDNDVEYLPGWCDEVTRRFDENANLGQLGLRTLEEEGGHPNVGGNCVVTPDVFAQVRWQDIPWRRGRATEDLYFTKAVRAAGFDWERVQTPCIVHLGTGTPKTDSYYAETWRAKGYGGY